MGSNDPGMGRIIYERSGVSLCVYTELGLVGKVGLT